MAQYAGVEIQIAPITVENGDTIKIYVIHEDEGALYEEAVAITIGIPDYSNNEFDAGDSSSVEVTAQNLADFYAQYGDHNNYYNIHLINPNTVFLEANTYDVMSFQVSSENPSWAQTTIVYREEPDPIEIDEISASTAQNTNTQTNVRYEFSVLNGQYPFEITSPITKTVNDDKEQWFEYERFPNNIKTLEIEYEEDVSSKDIPRVDMFDVDDINIIMDTNTNATIEIERVITDTDDPDGIRLDLLYSIDNSNWQSSKTFTDVDVGTHTAYIKDQFDRKVNQQFTVEEQVDPQYNIKFKINGDQPPFNTELRKSSDDSVVDSMVINSADSLKVFEDVSSGDTYYIWVEDAIGNTDTEEGIMYST
ncbi:MAG: hypothetical protein ACOC2W_01375 [bacterium]